MIVCQFATLPSSAQEKFYGVWYQLDQGGQDSRERMILSKTKMVAERLQTYEVEAPFWEVDKESLFKETKMKGAALQISGAFKGAFFGGEIWSGNQEGELLVYQMRKPSSSTEEAFSKLDQNNFKELLSKAYYSAERLNQIQEMPGLSAITKEDLISTIEYIRSYEDLLADFVEANQDNRMRLFVGRIAENLRDRKFIALGYHPYKWEEGDTFYGDKFRNDTDLQKLNEASVHLKIF